MKNVFYIQAIRLSGPIVVEWVKVLSEEVGPVKRQARVLANTATDPSWTWPIAQAVRVMDQYGAERFRCWCRVPLRDRNFRQLISDSDLQAEAA